MLFRRFVSPTAVVSGNGLLWTVVALSAFVVGASSLSPLYDEVEGGGIAAAATDFGDRQQPYPVQNEEFGGMRTAENDRKHNMKKLLLLALLKLAKEEREQKTLSEIDQLNTAENIETGESQVSEQKRGRWQGFCFRKSRSGRIHPYICWKGSDI